MRVMRDFKSLLLDDAPVRKLMHMIIVNENVSYIMDHFGLLSFFHLRFCSILFECVVNF